MIFQGYNEEEGWLTFTYATTWKYDYQIMVDIVQTLISNDFQHNLQRIATAEIVDGAQVERLDEVKKGDYNLNNCECFKKEHGIIAVAGFSSVMSCPIQIAVYNQTNTLKLFCPQKDLVEKHGERVFDNYLNSIEIRAYRRDAERKTLDTLQKIQGINQ